MKIAVDARMLGRSGIGTYLRNVLPRLVPLRPEWSFLLLGRADEIRGVPWPPGGNVSTAELHSPIYSLREQLALPALVPRDRDLLWSPHFNVPLLYSGRMLVTIHDVLHLARPEYMPGPHKRLFARLLLSAVRRKADAVICNSRFTADELMRVVGVAAERIEVIYMGVDEDWFAVDPRPRPHARPYFVFVGNVKSHKNVAGLLAAFAGIADRIPHDLIIVGQKEGFITGDDRVEKASLALGGRVTFTGAVNDALLKRYVACAEALVLPSFYEGFGLPALEAMACGCPAIVSDRAALPEVCADAALYCDPDDAEDIAHRLLEVSASESLRADLRRRGLERARQFDWGTCARQTMGVIDRIGSPRNSEC